MCKSTGPCVCFVCVYLCVCFVCVYLCVCVCVCVCVCDIILEYQQKTSVLDLS